MRPRLNFANVAAGLALFFSLAGSSYAVSQVNGKDVVDGSLTGKDIKNNSIKIKDIDGIAAKIVVRQGTTETGGTFASGSAGCKAGEDLISGGYAVGGNTPVFTIVDRPAATNSGTADAWAATIAAITPGPGVSVSVTPFAVCAS